VGEAEGPPKQLRLNAVVVSELIDPFRRRHIFAVTRRHDGDAWVDIEIKG
jgi:hypothetical protein